MLIQKDADRQRGIFGGFQSGPYVATQVVEWKSSVTLDLSKSLPSLETNFYNTKDSRRGRDD
jgi:hypothetical protein